MSMQEAMAGVEPTQQPENSPQIYALFQEKPGAPVKYSLIPVSETTRLSDIKNAFSLDWGIAPHQQIVQLNGTVIENDETDLRSLGLNPSSTTTMIFEITPTPDYQPNEEETNKEQNQQQQQQSSSSYYSNYDFWRRGRDSDSEGDYEYDRPIPSHKLVGLKNQGATCYLNSLVQVLYHTPDFRKMIYNFERPWENFLNEKLKKIMTRSTSKQPTSPRDKEAKPEEKRDIILEMQLLFSKMQSAKVSSVSTAGLTSSFGWTNSDIFVQHDVQELNRVLCDKLEEIMKPGIKPGDISIAKLYRGNTVNMIKCTNCERISLREEDYYDISLPIKGKKDIRESLAEFVEIETLKDGNAYHCEKCNSKQTAEKSTRFKTYPEVLNFQLKRFEFDWERDVRVKLNDEINFPTTLDLSDYLVDPKVLAQQQNSNQVEPHSPQVYDLFGVCIHSGNAGFGHYYAYIKNYYDGRWYKFNDETVSPVEESDIKQQNFGERMMGGYGAMSSTWYQKSATPYMLVYRKMPVKENKVLPIQLAPVIETDIPVKVREFLDNVHQFRVEKKKVAERERNQVSVQVFRNRLDLPTKFCKVDRNIKLGQLLPEVIKLVSHESATPLYYRFRRIAARKNSTKRPANIMRAADLDKTLVDLGMDKKPYIYLEQSPDPEFTGLNEKEDESFVTVRTWSDSLNRPVSLGDFPLSKNATLRDLKKHFSPIVNIPVEEIIIVEEETERNINFMALEDQALSKYGIITGDIIHIERARKDPPQPDATNPNPNNNKIVAMCAAYYLEKSALLVVSIEENEKSFKRRSKAINSTPSNNNNNNNNTNNNNANGENGNNDTDMDMQTTPTNNTPTTTTTTNNNTTTSTTTTNPTSSSTSEEHKVVKHSFKLHTSRKHTLANLKEIIAYRVGVDPRKLRVYAKEFGDGRLLKDLSGRLGTLLAKYPNSGITTNLLIELLDQPEDLRKGDKLLNIKLYTAKQEFRNDVELRVNKKSTIFNLKQILQQITGVPPENQLVSEWYHDRFYRLFPDNDATVESCRIRKTDILRMDVVELNYLESPSSPSKNLIFQLVQYIGWEASGYGRKEMSTSFPTLFVVPEGISLYDFRLRVAERAGLSYWNLNWATCNSFPILEGSLHFVRAVVNNHAPVALQESEGWKEREKDIVEKSGENSTDEDVRANFRAMAENTSGRLFNFKGERAVKLSKGWYRPLEVLVWEDLRATKNKPEEDKTKTAYRKKTHNRDSEVLKIK